jgi:hypothetical protein
VSELCESLGHSDDLDELEWAQATARKSGGVASSFASSAARPAVTPDFMPRRGLGLDFDADSDAPPHAHVRCAHVSAWRAGSESPARAHRWGSRRGWGGFAPSVTSI